ncbi:MAG: glycosyltransferase family 4 protein [Saprospiraceae bacterium]|nr:glycosyltransferase family 4 protein [Saprospiraceae bacterium]
MNILFIYPNLSTFIAKDINFLKSKHSVLLFEFNVKSKWQTPTVLVKQFFFLLRNIWSADLILVTFSSYHTFLPCLFSKFFRKKSIIVVGGVDAHKFPEISYGNFSKPLLSTVTNMNYKLCDVIFPKHKSLVFCEYNYFNVKFIQQGIRAFCSVPKAKFVVIENGYNNEYWKCKNFSKVEYSFITVGSHLHLEREFYRKGIDLICQLARTFDYCSFTIIGGKSLPIQQIPSNVILLDHIDNNGLIDYYCKSEFYLQLSIAEGFPNSLCESMLCECIPIGANCFGIPDIIGESGYILNNRSIDELIALTHKAINERTLSHGANARKRISNLYTEKLRFEKLDAGINQLFIL